MFQHIKTKILIFLIPIVIISIISSLFISVKMAEEILGKEIENKMIFIDRLKTQKVEEILATMETISVGLASTVSMSYKDADFDQYEELVTSTLQTTSEINGIGIIMKPNVIGEDVPYAVTYSQYEEDGILVSSTDYEAGKYNFYNRDYYKLAQTNDDLTFITPFKEAVTGKLIFVSTYPIKNEKDEFIGCIITRVLVDDFTSVLVQYIDDDSQLYIIDAEGNVVVNSDDSTMERLTSLDDIVDVNLKSEMKKALASQNEEDKFTCSVEGKSYDVYLTNMKDFGLKIVYTVSNENVYASLKSVMPYFFALAIFTILFLTVATISLIRRNVEKPINVLITEFNKIASNEYTTKAPSLLEQSKDEFGILGKKLTVMKTHLKSYQVDLEVSMNENLCIAEELKVQNDSLMESELVLEKALNYNRAILTALPEIVLILNQEGNVLECRGKSSSRLFNGQLFVGKNVKDIAENEAIGQEVMNNIKKVRGTTNIEVMEFSTQVGEIEEYFDLRFAECTEDQVLVVCANTTQKNLQIREIAYLNNYDQLTGMLNRLNMRITIKQLLKDKEVPFTILLINLNGLKVFNSSYGYEEGDRFILELANILKNSNLENKKLAYYGSGEFIIVLKNGDENDAEKYIASLREECKKHYVNDINVTFSFGYYTVQNSNETSDYAFNTAEKRMLKYKRQEYANNDINTIEIINRTLHAKSPREQYHSERVAKLCREFAIAVGFIQKEQEEMYTAGLLHDIGKIGIPENILDKPGKLSSEEFFEMKRHPEIGHKILEVSDNMKDIANIIMFHHEKWDGTGYPFGLQGENIPFKSRMITIIDSYDAMVSDRSYRAGMSKEDAIAELERCVGTQFDPTLVNIFIQQVLQ